MSVRWRARLAMMIAGVLVTSLSSVGSAQSTSPADLLSRAAQAAERAGNLREALRLYTAAQRVLKESADRPEDDAIYPVIFRIAAALQPPPALPDSAEVYEVRAQIAFDSAKTQEDFVRAANEFRKAILVAPWVPQYFYNIAVLAEKSGAIPVAIRGYRLYLQHPSITDRDAVRRKLIGLEYQLEQDRARFAAFDERLGRWVGSTLIGPHMPIDYFAERAGYRLDLIRQGDTLLFFMDDSVWFGTRGSHPFKARYRAVIRGGDWNSLLWSERGVAVSSECRAVFGNKFVWVDVHPAIATDSNGPALTFDPPNLALEPPCEMRPTIASPRLVLWPDPPLEPGDYTLEWGVAKRGELRATDSVSADGRPVHVWRFHAERGQRARVRVQAYAFEFTPSVTVVFEDENLRRPVWSGMATPRASGSDKTNAEAVLNFNETGPYRILVTSAAPSRSYSITYGTVGRYRISVSDQVSVSDQAPRRP